MSIRSVMEEGFIPFISYRGQPSSTQSLGFWGSALQRVGKILRNAFYLPLYNEKTDPDFALNQKLAEKVTGDIHFNSWEAHIHLEGTVQRIFKLRVFESKEPIHGKTLRIVLFSFYGHLEGTTGWDPLTIRELSESALTVMRAFKAKGIHFDSWVTTSLGNVALDGLKYGSSELPPTLIINRGFTSVKKVAQQLYSFPWNYLLYGAAKLCGWDANPEQELLNFVQKSSPSKIVIIEALQDFYFSGKGGFQPDFHQRLTQVGASVFRAGFYPFPFHTRAHHALSLDHLVNNSATQVHANTMSIDMERDESMAAVIARNIFLKGNDSSHTCFYICGNDATLEIGIAREIVPLLSAFVAEGEKLEFREEKVI